MRALDAVRPAGSPRALLRGGLAVYALYWVLFIVQPQIYRVSFLLIALVLTFLLFPAAAAGVRRTRVPRADWLLDRRRAGRARLAAVRFPPVRLPRRRADRRSIWCWARPPSCWCSKRHAGPWDGSCRPPRSAFLALRLARAVARRPRPRPDRAPRLRPGAAGRHALHDARRHLRRTARRHRDLHRPVHDLRRPARAQRRRRVLHRLGARRQRPIRPPRPAAR